jgi:beta-lactamase class A
MFASIALAATLSTSPSPDLGALKRQMDRLCRNFQGRIGYCVAELHTDRSIGLRQNERFPTASTIKTALMVEAICQIEEGKLNWTDKRPVPPMEGRQASQWAYHFKDGTTPDLDGWVNLMMSVSDNTATMLLRKWLGTLNVKKRMEGFGLQNTTVLGDVPAENEEMTRLRAMFGLGMTTPSEMNRLLKRMALGKLAGPAATDKMIRIMSKQYWDDFIGATVPPDVRYAGKVGAINRSRSDSAVVFCPNPYVLTIYTDSQKDQRWVAENEGNVILVKLATLVWDAFNPNRKYRLPKGSERYTPTGGGVD